MNARLIVRSQWGARPPRAVTPLPADHVHFLVVHYSAMHADEQAHHENCAARVRGIQRFHMDTRGWNDIAYNWLVCKHGFVFRGRGWGVRSAATGATNDESVAVCFLGDDVAGRDDVTDPGRGAIVRVFWFVVEHAPNFRGTYGHRDFMQTECPGDELYRFAHGLQVLPGQRPG